MQTSEVIARGPRAFRTPPRPPAGTDQHSIAGLNSDARELLPRVEIFGIDWCAGLEKPDTFHARNVDEDAAREDSAFHPVNRELAGAFGCHFAPRDAVVHAVLVEVMAERVEMRVCEAVVRDGERIAMRSGIRRSGVDKHLVHKRARIIGGSLRLSV